MSTIYIDLSASTDGSGSIYNPRNTVSAISNFNGGGNLNGQIFAIKANGASKQETLKISSASNFHITTYGSGSSPILDGSDSSFPTQPNWIWDDSQSLWYLSEKENQCLYCANVQFLDSATLNICQSTSNTSWFDSINTRLYINHGLGNGVNPNSLGQWNSVRSTNLTGRYSESACTLYFLRCANYITENIAAIRAYDTCHYHSFVGSNLIIQYCRGDYAGGWSQNARDGFSVYGTDDYNPGSNYGNLVQAATGVSLCNNQANYCQNNGFELWGVDSALLSNNSSTYSSGFELWGFVTNTLFQNNTITKCGLGRFATNNTQASLNTHEGGVYIANFKDSGRFRQKGCDSNTFANNIFETTTGHGVWLCDGSNTKLERNTFIIRNSQSPNLGAKPDFNRYAIYIFWKDGPTISAELDNNIFYMQFVAGLGDTLINYNGSNINVTGDKNCWWFNGANLGFGNANVRSGYNAWPFSTYQAQMAAVMGANIEQNSINRDPQFTDLINGDFSLQPTSPCLDATLGFTQMGAFILPAN